MYKEVSGHNPVSKGSEKWLHIKKWKNTTDCLRWAKHMGYKIACADVGEKSVSI